MLLIVENDLTFARTILDAAHQQGYKGVITGFGAAALTLTERFAPEAITLDISLPDINGWRILERLKHAPATRHIPVYVITTEEDRRAGLRAGALGFATKPLASLEAVNDVIDDHSPPCDDPTRYVLVVDADPVQREQIVGLLPRHGHPRGGGGHGVGGARCRRGQARSTASSSIRRCRTCRPTRSWSVSSPARHARPARSLVYRPQPAVGGARAGASGAWPSWPSSRRCSVRSDCSIRSRCSCTGGSTSCPEAQRQTIHDLHGGDKSLAGRKVLIVDDDIRNIFALTSILEQHQMLTVAAETGRDAIGILERTPDVEAVLMDVMMPEMDGLDTTRAIRQNDAVPRPADHRGDGQGHAGRPREVHRGGRLGLSVQARRSRGAAGDAAGVAGAIALGRDPAHARGTLRLGSSSSTTRRPSGWHCGRPGRARRGSHRRRVRRGSPRLLLDHDVAVILLDVNMPEMDGFETAALIRQRPRSRHTPIIFLTADTDEMLQARAYSLGAVDFILNPFIARDSVCQGQGLRGAVEDARPGTSARPSSASRSRGSRPRGRWPRRKGAA